MKACERINDQFLEETRIKKQVGYEVMCQVEVQVWERVENQIGSWLCNPVEDAVGLRWRSFAGGVALIG